MDRNCGLCGFPTCEEYRHGDTGACPYDQKTITAPQADYAFILHPLPGEPSARKSVLPFNPWKSAHKGEYIVGRPMGQGCPVQHVIEVIDTDLETLVIEGWVVGQEFARNYPVKDIKAYSVIAFEGIAEGKPEFGKRQRFLPGFCMMNIVHTGVLSMVTKENGKYHVRIEDIRIM